MHAFTLTFIFTFLKSFHILSCIYCSFFFFFFNLIFSIWYPWTVGSFKIQIILSYLIKNTNQSNCSQCSSTLKTILSYTQQPDGMRWHNTSKALIDSEKVNKRENRSQKRTCKHQCRRPIASSKEGKWMWGNIAKATGFMASALPEMSEAVSLKGWENTVPSKLRGHSKTKHHFWEKKWLKRVLDLKQRLENCLLGPGKSKLKQLQVSW